MRSDPIKHCLKKIAHAYLTASVHFYAFRTWPKAYLTATKWWIKRKRVRARGQFAPLLSRAPKAYRLWMLRHEPKEDVHDNVAANKQTILALLDAGEHHEGLLLEQSLKSLTAEGISAIIIGSRHTPDVGTAMDQIDWEVAPWFLPLKAGDTIAPGTAAAYQSAMQNNRAKLIYADDDLLTNRYRRGTPHFKPDWNSELFQNFDYLSGSCVLHSTRAELNAVADTNDWSTHLVANSVKQAEPLHLRQMLHHRRTRTMPVVPAPMIRLASDLPPLSVIIPTRNHVNLLRTCLEGLEATHYPDIEVIIMDNDSDDPATLTYLAGLDVRRYHVVRHPGAFNYSAINNRAVAEARGRLLCLLNNDIEMIDPNWLAIMATQALRPEVGAVGARLLYPDGRIQHAGVVIGVANAAGHAHRFLRPNEEGYFYRHALPQFTSAVTAACLVVSRDKFLAAGGLDEKNFAVAFNDVDLCLRLNQKGWQSLYEPRATLIHHESVSRGFDRDPIGAARFAGELAALKQIWKTDEMYDPFHHPNLSRASEQFAVAL